jgi:serine/threonine protein kinase
MKRGGYRLVEQIGCGTYSKVWAAVWEGADDKGRLACTGPWLSVHRGETESAAGLPTEDGGGSTGVTPDEAMPPPDPHDGETTVAIKECVGIDDLAELDVQSRLSHPNLNSYLEFFFDEPTPTDTDGLGPWGQPCPAAVSTPSRHQGLVIYYVSEMANGTLASHLPRGSDVPGMVRDMCIGVAHLHRHGVYHGDLKPNNVLVFGSSLRVTDFGTAGYLRGIPPERCPTYVYAPPEALPLCSDFMRDVPAGSDEHEQLAGVMSQSITGKEVDMWGLGACIAFALAGNHVFVWRSRESRTGAVFLLKQMAAYCRNPHGYLRARGVRGKGWRDIVSWLMAPKSDRRPRCVEEVLTHRLLCGSPRSMPGGTAVVLGQARTDEGGGGGGGGGEKGGEGGSEGGGERRALESDGRIPPGSHDGDGDDDDGKDRPSADPDGVSHPSGQRPGARGCCATGGRPSADATATSGNVRASGLALTAWTPRPVVRVDSAAVGLRILLAYSHTLHVSAEAHLLATELLLRSCEGIADIPIEAASDDHGDGDPAASGDEGVKEADRPSSRGPDKVRLALLALACEVVACSVTDPRYDAWEAIASLPGAINPGPRLARPVCELLVSLSGRIYTETLYTLSRSLEGLTEAVQLSADPERCIATDPNEFASRSEDHGPWYGFVLLRDLLSSEKDPS